MGLDEIGLDPALLALLSALLQGAQDFLEGFFEDECVFDVEFQDVPQANGDHLDFTDLETNMSHFSSRNSELIFESAIPNRLHRSTWPMRFLCIKFR